MKLEITDIAALEAAYPKCVKTVKQPVWANIRAVLKGTDTIPGVRVVGAETPTPATAEAPVDHSAQQTEPSDKDAEAHQEFVAGMLRPTSLQ